MTDLNAVPELIAVNVKPHTEPQFGAAASGRGFDPGVLAGDGDGYEWLHHCTTMRWETVPAWGRDGWSLGDWPLVAVARSGDGTAFAVRTEGDVDVYVYLTADEATAGIDAFALASWRMAGADWLDTTPAEALRGPFSWDRLDANA